MKLIGLTGGIGSGKSTVAQLLVRHGWELVDADQIARDIVEPGQPALTELAQAFGEDILQEDGSLDRGLLASRAFSSREKTAVLNSITHPRINEETQARFDAARQAGADFVVYDMPLLVDKGLHKDMDATIVVDVDAEERVRRLVAYRGLDEEDARRRIAAQIPDDVRRVVADFIIDNNGPLEALDEQVEGVAEKLRARLG
ncbi:dephospho-CoA kinase [Corynebacterium sp. HMSC062E11]|uniref:dephospho-CoA kinase n=1 Tax=unclassified Corynebacterium TaxID=2624378 RepID=UPI0008A1A218|nr:MULTISPECIES: dephospho-CoA kinase [unclassified Corynebacterium]OFK25963.1 dephospho-CoA kinase [Corynebacterium sp. HMSC062E11]OFL59332.1 dephospho-CoA kinase [Corynebacterium sp. HMSC065D07]OFP70408.1 dephospho-CoA kinase [Corynebacterium sp. HMSC078C09]OFP87404.1 dephospho-CoA kinase [Corynebacterium sp. HMSC059E07]OFQ91028.1 dephospho-CoA kinase [Corynebacterium sp. HMSC056E09]